MHQFSSSILLIFLVSLNVYSETNLLYHISEKIEHWLDENEKAENDSEDITSGHLENYMSMMKDKFLKQFLSENPFSRMPKDQVEQLILKQVEGSHFAGYLQESPRMLNFLIDFVRDQEAFPALVSILDHPRKFKLYFVCFIILIIVSFLIDLWWGRGKGFLRRFLQKIILTCSVTSLQILIFVVIFYKHLKPTFNLI